MGSKKRIRQAHAAAEVFPLTEALFGAEFVLLHVAPVYYGLGVPRGDNSAVVVIPGFLGSDLYLMPLYAWLARIGYRPYFSGIGINADCPNLLIQRELSNSIDKARAETGRKIHLIGHSLGGVIARSVANQRPRDVASVITLGAPFRGTVAHSGVLRAAEAVRDGILRLRGERVEPGCYTGHCTCDFVNSLRTTLPPEIAQTAIYTTTDGLVDWRYCTTGNPDVDIEVTGTHIGMAFNPAVYAIVANRLAACRPAGRAVSGSR